MMGLLLIKESTGSPLVPSAMTVIYERGRGSSPDANGHLDFRLPASRTMRNKDCAQAPKSMVFCFRCLNK